MLFRSKWYGDKCKGVPARAKGISINELAAVFEFDKPLREREALKRGLIPNKWITMHKTLSILDDKRSWRGDVSYPIILDVTGFGEEYIDYLEMDMQFGYDNTLYKEKLKLKSSGSGIADLSEGDRLQRSMAIQDKRQRGEEIYQRGS